MKTKTLLAILLASAVGGAAFADWQIYSPRRGKFVTWSSQIRSVSGSVDQVRTEVMNYCWRLGGSWFLPTQADFQEMSPALSQFPPFSTESTLITYFTSDWGTLWHIRGNYPQRDHHIYLGTDRIICMNPNP